ncbi:sulfotransferase domain-containing protein [Ferrovibrio sp.]|uniref:sulfotransferase domain-containing protein n=1 Tax=Ferrovibrio sp. TaxID=1917215 RepID=UPI003D0B0772
MEPVRRKGNVWLASYPKSGNTWMRIALTSLRDGGAGVKLNHLKRGIGAFLAMRYRLDALLDIDSSDLTPEEVLLLRPQVHGLLDMVAEKVSVWKVHDCWGRTQDGEAMFPAEATAAAIYLVRDPRDIAVSYAHYFGIDIDKAIDHMADRSYRVAARTDASHFHLPQIYSSWSEHVLSWVDHSGLAPLVLKYEDMVTDMGFALRQVSDLIGWNTSDTAIEGAVASTRFDRLQEQERAVGFPEVMSRQRPFFRQGKAGAWRDTLSAAQVARIEAVHGAVMERLGYL